ncbi:hypothetical protein [Metabacillus sp. cB07]|uniref:hypothetical protein n=1 Tax=Metabacillus sp. cB07 TaxID=2806989 RepID=UPI00193ABE64|nr:hypothetical protein [Metabacillus sp. cB07]
MNIPILLCIIFILSFIVLYWFFTRENKKDKDKDSPLALISIAMLFSVLSTLVFAFFLFMIIGSIRVVDSVFSLHIDTGQLLIVGTCYLIYWLSIDSIFSKIFDYMMGDTIYSNLSLSFSRTAAFYLIGLFTGLSKDINLTLSIGVALILLVIDTSYSLYSKKSKIKV